SLTVTLTATTSYWVRVSNACGTANSTAATVTVTAAVPLILRRDFNRDGKADILFRNESTGANSVWIMNGTSRSSIVALTSLAGSTWHMEGAADFNSDGSTDILFHNSSSGATQLWLMSGTTRSSIVTLPTQASPWT